MVVLAEDPAWAMIWDCGRAGLTTILAPEGPQAKTLLSFTLRVHAAPRVHDLELLLTGP